MEQGERTLNRGNEMAQRSRLLSISVKNIGCIGATPVMVTLDQIVCLVGMNNAGKSTILTAYQLAKGKQTFTAEDRHQHAANNDPSEIVMEVHIPKGLGNIDEKWKVERDGLLVVKSRWQWLPEDGFAVKRQTWSPTAKGGQGDWDPDQKAGGFDSVFGARLPEPIRIGSLDDAATYQAQLLTMALIPLTADIALEVASPGSVLQTAINGIQQRVDALASNHATHFTQIASRVSTGVVGVFPSLSVSLTLSPDAPNIKFEELLKNGSKINISDGKTTTDPSRQGTGARRTLFWGMVKVLSELERDKAEVEQLQKDLKKHKDKLAKAKEKDVAALKEKIDEVQQKIKQRIGSAAPSTVTAAGVAPDPSDVAFPGYILLIDEPENALHPMAARAAQRYLYDLAKAGDWQVMLTTHSPYFVNPFEDHTTIVRMDRANSGGDSAVTKVYRSDSVKFVGTEKEELQALQQIDPSFSEVFFGSYPVIVEGDTEHAAFIASLVKTPKPLAQHVTPIRARGKALIVPLIKVLSHFKIPFGVLHDTDTPFIDNGNKNSAWTENGKIWTAIQSARANGVLVRHRVSVPDFERRMGFSAGSKSKPLTMYIGVQNSTAMQADVETLMEELLSDAQHCAVGGAVSDVDFADKLRQELETWAGLNGMASDVKIIGAH